MKILGYGEDALTYWALSNRLSDFLSSLDDQTDPREAVVFFRPSFGRRSRGGQDGLGARSEFGEFDAIVGTGRGVYLVESKWERSGELRDGKLTLRPEQVRRHAVFQSYLRLWRATTPATWSDFRDRAEATLLEEHDGLRIPGDGTRLAQSLSFVLSRLTGCGTRIENVVLLLQPTGTAGSASVENGGFRLVTLEYRPEPGGAFVVI